MLRALRIVLVGTLVIALCVDVGMACHFFGRHWGGYAGCRPAYCGGYVEYAGPCHGVVITSDGCYGDVDYGYGYGEYVDGCCEGGVVIEGEPIPAEEAPRPQPRERAPAETFRPMDREDRPALPPDAMPRDRVAPPAEEDELFAPAEEPLPRETVPVEPPAEVPPAEEPADELFAPPAETTPPPPTPPEGETDLFGIGVEEAAPPAEAPADEPETPAAEMEETEGLFGFGEDAAEAPAEEPAPPAEEPAEEPTDTDLFGGMTDGEATETPADEAPAEGTEEAAGEDAAEATEETPPATEETEDTGNLFEFGRILREPGGLASGEMRRWVDNTGEYSCTGRLIRFLDGKVRLLKENGRTTTVPLYRLSQTDLEFVHRQASAQQANVLGHTAQASSLVPVLTSN